MAQSGAAMKNKIATDITHSAQRAAGSSRGPARVGRSRSWLLSAAAWLGTLVATSSIATAAGTLVPKGSMHAPIEMVDHAVNVTINNGFAQTVVSQSFSNPNDIALEAVYRFPVPQSASLSEVNLFLGELQIDGEVVERERARSIYEQEKAAGNAAALAEKDSYRWFEFHVHPVRPRWGDAHPHRLLPALGDRHRHRALRLPARGWRHR